MTSLSSPGGLRCSSKWDPPNSWPSLRSRLDFRQRDTPSEVPLPYPNQRFIYNGRPAGPFRYEFAVPGPRHIRAADSIEADVHDGLLSVTVIHAKRN